MTGLTVTWWGHSTVTVGLGRTRVLTDPLLVDRLAHLRRHAASPAAAATRASLVLVSHLHADHLHVGSLRRVDPSATILVPRGAARLLRGLRDRVVTELVPGDVVQVGETVVEVLPAAHDDRRHPLSRRRGTALGFRVTAAHRSFWYPGDTGPQPHLAGDVAPVDLALVPVGGWGPSLGDGHLDPDQAAVAVRDVGARWALPVHWGTFWPAGLRRLDTARHHRLFTTPGVRFAQALSRESPGTAALLPRHGQNVEPGATR